MSGRRLTGLIAAALALAGLAFAETPHPAVAAESNMEQIKRTGVLRAGVIQYAPNWYRNPQSGQWEGFMVDAVRDMAKVMQVQPEFVETSWATMVLDLQSNKTDIQFGMQATPERALAVYFAGPLYSLSYLMINNKNFDAKNDPRTWEDYNNPKIRVASPRGTGELAVVRFVPGAEHVLLASEADAVLSSSRAVPTRC